MATTHTRPMSVAEFVTLPEPKAGRLELRHGELITVAPPNHKHYLIQRRLRRLLESAAGDAGEVDTEMAFRALPEHEYRLADVAFVTNARWVQISPEGNLHGVPELVIEVLSPNTAAEIIDKKTVCLENGAREFWVVDIEHRQVEVSTPDGRTMTYRSGQHIPLFFAVANAQLAVDAIFA